MHNYWSSARHPWPCLLFVLPLLFLYEAGMLWQAMEGQTSVRAGLDGWLYSGMKMYGLAVDYGPSLLMALLCVSWAVLKWDRSPPDALGIWAGIALESIIFALALWALGMVVNSIQFHLSLSPTSTRTLAFLGSGIFEEVLFRLIGFGCLFWLFRIVAQERIALAAALMCSALGFAAAHYLGAQGEPWQLRSFVFRTVAGACFVGLFHFRGLGVAVGTHSAYNVIVSFIA
jgi:hypothetical protein